MLLCINPAKLNRKMKIQFRQRLIRGDKIIKYFSDKAPNSPEIG